MTPERFEKVAARFERFSAAWPRLYRWMLALAGAAGLGFVAFWLVLSVGLFLLVVAGLVARPNVALVKIGIPIAILCWTLLKATWVRFERPQGIALGRADAPAAWAELDRLRRLGRLPRIHRLLVDDRLNAAMAQTPRLGIFGWPHNDVVLGLPLLLALGPKPLGAVLAHELGHLSGQHGRVAARIYRVRATLHQAAEALRARRSALAGPFRRFLGWYGPWFQAASLALARQQEREADRFSAQATDARTAADALVAAELAGWALGARYEPALSQRPALQPAPPEAHLSWMAETLRAASTDPEAPEALRRALEERAGPADTHPSLAQRLEALGQSARVPPPPERSAAEVLLGPALPRVQAALEEGWRNGVAQAWARAHEEGQQELRRLGELDAQAAARPLDVKEACDRVALTARRRGADEALALARANAETHPDHPVARFQLGRLLLELHDGAGLPHLERAMELDPDATLACARLIASHHLADGRRAEAAPWIERVRALDAREAAAEAERARVLVTDEVAPHGLPPEGVARVVAALRGHPRVGKAWLARKRLRHDPERSPVFVVGVHRKGSWYRIEGKAALAALAQALANAIPLERASLFLDGPATGPMLKKLRKTGQRII
jgi:Zn-dependent protease with chaperone function